MEESSMHEAGGVREHCARISGTLWHLEAPWIDRTCVSWLLLLMAKVDRTESPVSFK